MGKAEYKDDECAVACEPYSSWIIEADEKRKVLLRFASSIWAQNLPKACSLTVKEKSKY